MRKKLSKKMKSSDRAALLLQLRFGGNSASKAVWSVDLMTIARYILDSNGKEPSLVGTLQRRQFEVVAGYELVWSGVTPEEKKRIKESIGTEDEQKEELRNLFSAPRPFVLCARAHEDGTRDWLNENYNSSPEVLRAWPSLRSMTPIPHRNMSLFMQSLERCEFNAHLMAIVLSELMRFGNLMLKSRQYSSPGRLVGLGISHGLATITSNPLQLPYDSHEEKWFAQTIWMNDAKRTEKTPGYLYHGKLPHVVLRLAIRFNESTEAETTRTYYLDAASSQINIFDASCFKIAPDRLDYFHETAFSPFQHATSMKMVHDQIEALSRKLSPDVAQDVYKTLRALVRRIDEDLHCELHSRFVEYHRGGARN